MSGVHIFGWTSPSTTDESRGTRKTFSSNVRDLFNGTMRSLAFLFMPRSYLASSCIGHSRARNAEIASDGTSVMCAGVSLPHAAAREKLKSKFLLMEATV